MKIFIQGLGDIAFNVKVVMDMTSSEVGSKISRSDKSLRWLAREPYASTM